MGTAAAIHLGAKAELVSVILLAPLASPEDALEGLRARAGFATIRRAAFKRLRCPPDEAL